jgi:hypothetical protein
VRQSSAVCCTQFISSTALARPQVVPSVTAGDMNSSSLPTVHLARHEWWTELVTDPALYPVLPSESPV